MRAAASPTISRAIFSSTVPAPAASVSARCFSIESPGDMAAAMPPCAQAEDAPSPDRRRGEHGHRPRREPERAEQAGEPAADDDDVVGGVEPRNSVRSSIARHSLPSPRHRGRGSGVGNDARPAVIDGFRLSPE